MLIDAPMFRNEDDPATIEAVPMILDGGDLVT